MIEEQNLTERQRQIIRFFHQNTFADHMNVEVVPEEGGSVHLELWWRNTIPISTISFTAGCS